MTTTVTPRPVEDAPLDRERRAVIAKAGTGDHVFRGLTRSGSVVVLAVFAAIGLFLAIKASSAIRVAKFKFLTTQAWEPDIHHFGIAGIMADTLFIALVAVVIAIPISLGLALFISEIAPDRLKRPLVSLVDLMAAVPSVVYGLWALLLPPDPDHRHLPVAVGVARLDPDLQGQRHRGHQPDRSRARSSPPPPSSPEWPCR